MDCTYVRLIPNDVIGIFAAKCNEKLERKVPMLELRNEFRPAHEMRSEQRIVSDSPH